MTNESVMTVTIGVETAKKKKKKINKTHRDKRNEYVNVREGKRVILRSAFN